jgi:hypothetical protein
MLLSDVCTIKTHFEDADFWIVRRGSLKTVGEPVRIYNPEHIGIKVLNAEILLPDYLFYCMDYLHGQRLWEAKATGSIALVNIRVTDVRNIRLSPM